MIVERLKELFPDATVNNSTRMGDDYFSIPIENKWIHFPSETISEREKKLIIQLASPETIYTKQKKNRWADFLMDNGKEIPPGFNQVQILQVMVKTADADSFDENLWLDAFKHTLPYVEDGFFISENYGIVIIHNPSHIEMTDEIEGLLNVLDDDFTIQTSVYLGQSWPVDTALPNLFSEEQQIFLDTRTNSKRNKISYLAAIALAHYSYQATSKSPILNALKNQIRDLEGSPDLIVAMWDNLGNVSKAAADLYVHRNTLQYRLDRFFQQTGLNLKNMDDLLLSYLASLSRFED